MFHVIRDGAVIHTSLSGMKAVVLYTKEVTCHKQAHVLLVEGDPLPGLPNKVIAQRFGNPPDDPPEPGYVGPVST